ncbi:MAG: queuosine precursor transporter [Bacteroidetes bacterium]|uniref:Probable queuosine precursor transporter n=1 Tax=Candidatus Cryptobacteroides avistercoris TaxID=2840758 RepID=A0A9D9IZH2_9BACT|nr:queuosine precursor transporter [Candidatus Cryptobacteroides avistercoris]
MSKFSTRFLVMAVVFAVCLITSNFFVPRVWQVGGLPLQLSGAVLLFPISYIINDCLTEVYGYRKARLVIWLAFALSAFTAVMSGLVCLLPEPFDEGSKPMADSFNSLFGMVPRTTIASLLAFIAGSTVNAWILSRMKVATGGKAFGVRAVLSSVGGELVDSCIFFPFVFWGIMSPSVIAGMVFTQVVVKTLYEIVILPFTAWFVKRLKAREGVDTYDRDISYNPFKISDIQ